MPHPKGLSQSEGLIPLRKNVYCNEIIDDWSKVIVEFAGGLKLG
jgi:hypothetical protein